MNNRDEEIEKGNKEIWDITQTAIYNAKKAFRDTLDEAGFDSAYWSLRLEVRSLSDDFSYIVDTQTFDDLQIPKKEVGSGD